MVVLYVLLGIAVVVTVALLLPIGARLYNDADNRFHYRVTVCGFSVWDDTKQAKPKKQKVAPRKTPKPKGENRFYKNIREHGLVATVSDTVQLLQTVLGEVFRLVRHVRIPKLNLQILCVGEDAADAALKYGRCCALVFPLAGFVHSLTNVKPKGEHIDIRTDFLGDEEQLYYEVHLSVKSVHVLTAVIRFLLKESARFTPDQTQKNE